MDKLIEYICDELEELERKADKGKLSMAEMQYVDMLAHAKKNLLKGDEMMDGESYADSRNPIYYRARDGRDGMSNARGRRRDSRGRYSALDSISRYRKHDISVSHIEGSKGIYHQQR